MQVERAKMDENETFTFVQNYPKNNTVKTETILRIKKFLELILWKI